MTYELSKRATQITMEDAAKEEAEKKKGASKKADKESGQKKGEKQPSKNKADTTTTTTTDTKRAEPTSDVLASTASAMLASTTSVTGLIAPAQTGLRSAFDDYSFMSAGNNGDNDDDLDIISNEAPFTLKTTRKGFKSARGRTPAARTRRSHDESNISPSSLPMPHPPKPLQVKPAPPTQQQGASLPRRSNEPLEVRMTSAPPKSKGVINISQGLDVLSRVMMKMQATIEHLEQRCEVSDSHLSTIVDLLSQEVGMSNEKRKHGEEENDDTDAVTGDKKRLHLDDTEQYQNEAE
ncbi:hypothetical protein KEM55_000638, partial [Ascosphaera atra]